MSESFTAIDLLAANFMAYENEKKKSFIHVIRFFSREFKE